MTRRTNRLGWGVRRGSGLAVAASLLILATASGAHSVPAGGKTAGAKNVSASKSAKGVTISGWATFSGTILAAAKDGKDDGVTVATTGQDTRGDEIIESSVAYRPELGDLFIRIQVTKVPTVGGGLGGGVLVGDPSVIYGLKLKANGTNYEVRIARAGGTGGTVIDPQFGLFECTEVACTPVENGDLKGGYGTTGEEMVVALPLSKLQVTPGKSITLQYAFTAQGTFASGPLPPANYLDTVTVSRAPGIKVPVQVVKVTVKGRTQVAVLKKGFFEATFPKSLFQGKTPVTTTTCLGTQCVRQHFTVEV